MSAGWDGTNHVERAELGSAARGEDEEGRPALRSGDLRLESVNVVFIDRSSPTFLCSDRP